LQKFFLNLWHIFLVKIYICITVASSLYSIILSIVYKFTSKCYDEYCRVMRSQFYMQGYVSLYGCCKERWLVKTVESLNLENLYVCCVRLYVLM
jgi:hypothetical protein